MKAWLLLGLMGAILGGIYWSDRRQTQRIAYCNLACADARRCNFLLPDACEDHCMMGHRKIELPRTCEQLKENVDKAGYLW